MSVSAAISVLKNEDPSNRKPTYIDRLIEAVSEYGERDITGTQFLREVDALLETIEDSLLEERETAKQARRYA